LKGSFDAVLGYAISTVNGTGFKPFFGNGEVGVAD